jgi:exonuclease SbcC
MGSGKSSLLEGISFALFGTFPALERRKLKLENVIRIGLGTAKAVVGFEWDGAVYRVERALERSKKGAVSTNAEIFKDGTSVERGTTAVTSYVEGLMALDYDLFTRAIYSEQNNIDYFLNLDPRHRKQEIDALLGLDKFEIARTNIVTVTGRVRTKKQAIEERFNKEKVAELERKEKTHSKESAAFVSRLKEVEGSSEKQQKEAKDLSSRFEAMRKERELFERLEKERIGLSAQQQSLEKELKEALFDDKALEKSRKRLSSLLEERSKLSTSAKSIDEENVRLSKEAGSVEAGLRTASQARKNLETVKKELSELLKGRAQEQLSKEQDELRSALVSMESESKSLEHEMAETAELMGKLRPDVSKCPLCSTKLTEDGISHIKAEKEALVRQKKARAAELQKLIAAKRKDAEALASALRKASLASERLPSLEQEAKDLEKLQSRKTELETELTKARGQRQGMQKELDKLTDEVEKLRVEINTFEATLRKKKQLEEIDKRLAELRNQLTAVKFDEKAFEGLREKAEKARIAAERLLSQKETLGTQLRVSKDMLKLVQEELSQMRQMEKDVKDLYKLEEQLLMYKNALVETQKSLRESLTDAINSAMNEIWTIFYPYKNYQALRLAVTEKDYIFEVDDGTGWKGLETIASGGERASAALTLRVALAMVLTPRLSWLILDEPTHNLDTEAVELLSAALQYKVPEVVKQTFVITHDEAFMGSEFASSYRLTRDKEQNGATEVEAL